MGYRTHTDGRMHESTTEHERIEAPLLCVSDKKNQKAIIDWAWISRQHKWKLIHKRKRERVAERQRAWKQKARKTDAERWINAENENRKVK